MNTGRYATNSYLLVAASKGKARNPLSTRDREQEIPSGDIRTTGVTGASGKLVGALNGSPGDIATLTFKDGRLVKVEPKGKTPRHSPNELAFSPADPIVPAENRRPRAALDRYRPNVYRGR